MVSNLISMGVILGKWFLAEFDPCCCCDVPSKQPSYDDVLDIPPTRRPEQVNREVVFPVMSKAPRILSRWKNGITFGEFSKRSLESYYT